MPDKRPLLVGLAAALLAVVLTLWVSVGPFWRDAAWSLCITIAALTIGWYERQLARAGQPSRLLRWIAMGLVIVAVVFLALALHR